jgi:hypothetical protein
MIAMIMRVCWSFHNYDWMNIEGVGEVLFGDSFWRVRRGRFMDLKICTDNSVNIGARE